MTQTLNDGPDQLSPAWLPKHDGAAIAEGWSIFDCDGSDNGRWQLCRIDGASMLPEFQPLASDDEAWKIVATGTGAHHLAARQFLKVHNPQEFAAVMTPRVGDRVYLEPDAAFFEADQRPVPSGWYILHRVRNVSGKIDSPDAWVTLCRENNEPGDYITTTAEKISLLRPIFKCRLVTAAFWKVGDDDAIFESLFEAVDAAEDFLIDAMGAGNDYTASDIEIVTEEEVVNLVEARKKLGIEKQYYVFFIRDHKDKAIGHVDLPSSIGRHYTKVESFPQGQSGTIWPVQVQLLVRFLGVQHLGVFDIDGRKLIELSSSQGDEAFNAACRYADRTGKVWTVSGSSELFEPETRRCWSHKIVRTVPVIKTEFNPSERTTKKAPSDGALAAENSFPVLFQVDPESKEATGTVMPFCSDDCREASANDHGMGEVVKGVSKPEDFGYTVHCEQCGMPVAVFKVEGCKQVSQVAQRKALSQLKRALQQCTETGVFDSMTVDVHPDLINAFCDEVDRFELDEKAVQV